jgi:hypothetical protein
MYFSSMPQIYYDFVDTDGLLTTKVVTDITTNVRFIRQVLENITTYDEYDIIDGETPEMIAGKIYGNPLYHWVIMLANDRYDYREDFPLDYTALLKRAEMIYGAGDQNMNAIHHYEAVFPDGHILIVNSNYIGAYGVTNFQYEEKLNESKRRIKIISKPVLDTVVKEYIKMFN